MSVHHLDMLRWLFGQPDAVYTSARRDPRTTFRASVWVGPATAGLNQDPYIRWRVEGDEGVAEGWLGWPHYPDRRPSEMRFNTLRQPDAWIQPSGNKSGSPMRS